MSGSRPRVLATAIAVALSVLLAAPAGARKPKKPRKPRPDLIVTGVNWDGSSYLIQNELNTITFDDQTMNAARKGSRTAGPSTTALRLYQSYGGPFVPTKVSRPVPALKPRSSSVAKTTKTGRIGPGFLGTYVPFACADTPDRVAERKERNNCTSAYDLVTILARKWMGTVTGAWSTNGIQEKWTADVTFTFDRETHPNVYAYSIELARG